MPPKKKIVFISHVASEGAIATELKNLVEASFLSLVDVFVSSDPSSLPVGEGWLARITEALKNCSVEIVLSSPVSVRRQWINFEAGAGYIRGIPVIPICHSGMTRETLPAPFSFLQAVDSNSVDQLKSSFQVIASALGSAVPSAVDFSSFLDAICQYEETSREIVAMERASHLADSGALAPHELSCLAGIAELADVPYANVRSWQLAEEMDRGGFNRKAVTLGLARLERLDLVVSEEKNDGYGDTYYEVRLTPKGLEYLIDNQNAIELRTSSQAESNRERFDDDIPF